LNNTIENDEVLAEILKKPCLLAEGWPETYRYLPQSTQNLLIDIFLCSKSIFPAEIVTLIVLHVIRVTPPGI